MPCSLIFLLTIFANKDCYTFFLLSSMLGALLLYYSSLSRSECFDQLLGVRGAGRMLVQFSCHQGRPSPENVPSTQWSVSFFQFSELNWVQGDNHLSCSPVTVSNVQTLVTAFVSLTLRSCLFHWFSWELPPLHALHFLLLGFCPSCQLLFVSLNIYFEI